MVSTRFAILKAGHANREARERLGDFDGMFRALLRQAGQAWDVFDVGQGSFPAHLEGYGGFVITGSKASAYDPHPWIARLLETARAIHAQRLPLLGVCFGHQVVAQALGGVVLPSPNGWDIGVRSLTLTPAGSTIVPWRAATGPAVFELHADEVVALPPGATVLAHSEHTACEMYMLGATTLCIQGHPEFDPGAIEEALSRLEAAQVVPAERAARARASLATPVPRDFWQRWLQGFLAGGGLPQAVAPAPAAGAVRP